MKNKKVLVIVGLILSVILLFGLAGCDKDPTITQVQSDITTLQSEITTINTNITNLQASVAGIQVPNLTPINNSITAIQTKLTSLESDLADLQDSLNDPNSYATKAELNIITGDLTSLSNTVSTINTDLTELTGIVNSLSNRLESLENDIDSFLTVDGLDLSDIENYIIDLRSRVSDLEDIVDNINVPDVTQFQDDIDTLYENDLYLDGRIDALQTQVNTYTSDNATITGFSGLTSTLYQVNFKVNKTGTFAVLLTIYGSNVDLITYSAGTGYTCNEIYDDYYGHEISMRTIILSPDSIKSTSMTTSIIQWTAGQNYTIYFTLNGATITCINIDTAVR